MNFKQQEKEGEKKVHSLSQEKREETERKRLKRKQCLSLSTYNPKNKRYLISLYANEINNLENTVEDTVDSEA